MFQNLELLGTRKLFSFTMYCLTPLARPEARIIKPSVSAVKHMHVHAKSDY